MPGDPFGIPKNRFARLDEAEWIGSRVDNPRFWTPSIGWDVEFERPKTSDAPLGWTWANASANSVYVEWMGSGTFSQAQEVENNHFFTRPFPNMDKWEMYAKLYVMTRSNTFTGGGIYLYDTVSGKFIRFNAVQDGSIEVFKYNSFTSGNSAIFSSQSIRHSMPLYMRIRRNSTTSYDYMLSQNCLNWITLQAANDPTAFVTPTNIGFGSWNANSGTAGVSFEWVRVRPFGRSFRGQGGDTL